MAHLVRWYIVDLPIKDGDFQQLCKRLPEDIHNHQQNSWTFNGTLLDVLMEC